MISLLNIGSLILGIIAWAIPIISIINKKRAKESNWAVFSLTSIGACGISLFFQILYNHHLVEIQDWSALMDTSRALTFASIVLLAITMILNILNFNIYRSTAI